MPLVRVPGYRSSRFILQPVFMSQGTLSNPGTELKDAVGDNRMSPKRICFANPLQALQTQRSSGFNRDLHNMNSCCTCRIGLTVLSACRGAANAVVYIHTRCIIYVEVPTFETLGSTFAHKSRIKRKDFHKHWQFGRDRICWQE